MAKDGTQSGYDPKALGGQLGGQLTNYASAKAPVWGGSLYPGWSDETYAGFNALKNEANDPTYKAAVDNTIGEFGDIAAGKRFGMDDPGYAELRQGVADDTITGVNSVFNSTGRFGAGTHGKALGQGLGRALGELDYGNFLNDQSRQFGAADRLPGLYDAGVQPGQTMLGLGQLRDQDVLTAKLAAKDQFDRTNNADYNRFLELLGAFNGSSQSPGMAPEVPWYQQALGYVAQNAGRALGAYAGGGF